uniref:Serine-threonine kinase receptor-associated protein n=1 Tax=Albugo laibachii Nc14 TaxID=890382 RepID=F0WJR6_9STRA|nr:WD domaincontaining protein putative [Albugo laibachii Nc14]|eukprot:CCA21517.1 WD domaincontaining protein putative [Albugo laibachii Nc14]
MLRHGDTGDWIGTFQGHKGAVWSAQLNHDATLAATGSADFSVKLWDAISGDLIATLEHRHVVKCVAFTPNGKRLLTAGHEKILRIFDLGPIIAQSEHSTTPIYQFQTKEIIRKLVAITDTIVVTGQVDGTISVWNLDTKQLHKSFRVDSENTGGVMDMERSRNGDILTLAAGNKVAFFDIAEDYALRASFMMPMSFKEEGGVSLHPMESKFIAGGSDTWVRVFDFQTGEMIECHKGHHGPIRCLRYSPSGKSFATGSEDGTIRIWQNGSDVITPVVDAV